MGTNDFEGTISQVIGYKQMGQDEWEIAGLDIVTGCEYGREWIRNVAGLGLEMGSQ